MIYFTLQMLSDTSRNAVLRNYPGTGLFKTYYVFD